MVAGAIKNLHTSGAIKACPLNCWIFVVFFFLSSRSFFFFFFCFFIFTPSGPLRLVTLCLPEKSQPPGTEHCSCPSC